MTINKKEHPNADIIKVKLREIRHIGLMPTQHKLLDQVEYLLDSNPKPLSVPNEAD